MQIEYIISVLNELTARISALGKKIDALAAAVNSLKEEP